MNKDLARILINLNSDFYSSVADSFSATRQAPWNGWKQLAQIIKNEQNNPNVLSSFSVLDLACGNLRFEEFFAQTFPNATCTFTCIDNCTTLLPEEIETTINFQQTDIATSLLEEKNTNTCSKSFDLSVSFGFMHHIPTKKMRLALLNTLISNTKQGGIIATSFWQFMNHENLAKKAEYTTAQAKAVLSTQTSFNIEELNKELSEEDYFLGWKNTEGIYRYCHNFTSEELDWLCSQVSDKAMLLERFQADGRNDALNTYLIFKKK